MIFRDSGPVVRLDVNLLDHVLIALYFATVLGIGFAARRRISSSLDIFLAGRGLPAWITRLAFVSANLGAIEILGMAANGAQYGAMTVHYYWIGAVPAMVFLGIVMMPFYYRSKVRSVPEFLRRRFNGATQLLNAITFAVAQILISGVNLYALALVMEALLGWPLPVSVVVSALIVLAYITLGGLSSAIYKAGLVGFGTELNASFWGAGIAFAVDMVVSVVVTLVTTPKPEAELRGLVYGLSAVDLEDDALAGDTKWYRSPVLLGTGALILAAAMYGVIL